MISTAERHTLLDEQNVVLLLGTYSELQRQIAKYKLHIRKGYHRSTGKLQIANCCPYLSSLPVVDEMHPQTHLSAPQARAPVPR